MSSWEIVKNHLVVDANEPLWTFRYVGVYGCQSPLELSLANTALIPSHLLLFGCCNAEERSDPIVTWQHASNGDDRTLTLTLHDFLVQWWFPCKSDKYQWVSETLQNKKEHLWNRSILSVLQVVNKHLKSSLQSTASWKRDSSRGLSGDLCISPGGKERV